MNPTDVSCCPLCENERISPYHRDQVRDYLQCETCDLVFVPRSQHLAAAEEKAVYDLHENNPDDAGYRRFLARLVTPLCQRLEPGVWGLDVGCGPGPALTKMLVEAGHRMDVYDPYYAPDASVLSQTYDFITLTEVVEHMAAPGRELDNLWSRLKPGGWLGIMTKRVRNRDAFKSWHYITDPTHVSYFSEATFQWLERHWAPAARLEVVDDDVILIGKA